MLATPTLASRAARAQSAPSAADRARARDAFRAGVQAYQSGDYQAALESFTTAYNAAPNPIVRVNIANCYLQLHRPVDALEWFEHFITEATNASSAQRREVESQVADLRTQVGEISLQIAPASAINPTATVDGNVVSTTRPVRLAVGHHVLEVRADGHVDHHQEIDVASRQNAVIAVALRAATQAATGSGATTTGTGAASGTMGSTGATGTTGAAGGATGSTGGGTSGGATGTGAAGASGSGTGTGAGTGTDTTASVGATGGTGATGSTGGSTTPRRGLPPGPFIGAAVGTGVFGVGWIVFGSMALSANGRFEREVSYGTMTTNPAELADIRMRGLDAANSARTFRLLSDISMVVTLAGATATVILLTQTNFRGNVEVAPVAYVGGGTGLSFSGRF